MKNEFVLQLQRKECPLSNRPANMEFEAEVRRTAEAILGAAAGECQPAHYVNSGPLSELDGMLRLRDVTHLIMATVSTKLDKAKSDIKKLQTAKAIEEREAPSVVMWFVTQKQLDAEHITLAKKAGVTAITLDQFRRRYFDGRKYISARNAHAFGSARNLKDDSVTISDSEYVALPMSAASLNPTGTIRADKGEVDVNWIAEAVEAGETVVLLAPFGAGKSLTTREVFKRIAGRYLEGSNEKVPVTLNLREHWGQEDAEEILSRHGRKIGVKSNDDLLAAWRAGMVTLLLDGFDEVGSQALASSDNKRFLSEARYRALKGVRELVSQKPKGSGVLVCGRDHYFDSKSDMERALGITVSRPYYRVQIGEFTDAGISEFLKKAGKIASVPAWLPRKPLLLGYLVHHGLLDALLNIDSDAGFGFIWNKFVENICHREATLEAAAMDAATVRKVLEFLSFKVRSTRSGLGPVAGVDLADAYQRVSGEAPGDGVLPHLQRLPALTPIPDEPGNRSFIDEDLLYALQGGALASFLAGSKLGLGLRPLSALHSNAIKMAAYVASDLSISIETAVAVAKRIESAQGRSDANGEYSHPQLVADYFELCMEMAAQGEQNSVDFRELKVEAALVGVIRADEVLPANVSFSDCEIDELRLAPVAVQEFRVRGGEINRVSGATSRAGMPDGLIDSACQIKFFEAMATNADVLRSGMDPGLKALVTILRKLYKQAGGGRKKAAFFRGISDQTVLAKIDPTLDLLESHGMLRMFNQVAHPVRSESARVDGILAGPTLSNDILCVLSVK
jgi:hypothetical protein